MHFCGFTEHQSDTRRYARTLANLNVGAQRTVRMIYFLPNDRPYRADVVQRMKDEILSIQAFFAEQMGVHGYGKLTFRVETDPQGEPIVHRVNGQFSDRYYEGEGDRVNNLGVVDEINQMFDLTSNIYLIIVDISTGRLRGGGSRRGKNGGFALLTSDYLWAIAHELGHGFGLQHDFNDGAYIMSYGWGSNGTVGRLSSCHAEYLSVHPYFNSNTPIDDGERNSIIEIISPRTYSEGSHSIPVHLKVSDLEGLHQVLLFVETMGPHAAAGFREVKACRGLASDREAVVKFDLDGVIPSDGLTNLSNPAVHRIHVEAVNTDGNSSYMSFYLAEDSPHHIATLQAHTGEVRSVSFSRDGTLASGGRDGTVRLWDAVARQNIATLEGRMNSVESVAFSPDGTLASGWWDGTIMLWDIAARQRIATLEGHTAWLHSVSFSPDGRTLASGGWDGTVRLWDAVARQNIATFEGHMNSVESVAFSPDGTLASGSGDGTIMLWDIAARQRIATLPHGATVSSVSISPDGETLASGGWDGTVKLWDVSTRQRIATLPHGATVSSVSISPDGETLASGGKDGTVKLWDVATRESFAAFGHTSPVYSVSFSPDGRTIASGTADGTIELWDTSGLMRERLEALAEIDIPDPNLRAAIATALGRPQSASIIRAAMATLTELNASDASISNLTGLEFATKLTSLDLGGNNISDISVVAGLTKLKWLNVARNNISDVSSLAGLTNLTRLYLGDNNISDISVVAGLTKLESLYLLWWGQQHLNLWGNNITDISVVALNQPGP